MAHIIRVTISSAVVLSHPGPNSSEHSHGVYPPQTAMGTVRDRVDNLERDQIDVQIEVPSIRRGPLPAPSAFSILARIIHKPRRFLTFAISN